MSRLQSIISAIVTYVIAVVAPSAEIWSTQGAQAGVIAFVSGTIAWGWAVWKNHNFTEAANEAQCVLRELKEKDAEFAEEELEFEDWGDEEDGIQSEE
jgi:hypothetical protein